MFLIDSSVWIDFFNGVATLETDFLTSQIEYGDYLVGDLILTEVLQGTRSAAHFYRALRLLSRAADQIAIADRTIAIQAARHYQTLRDRGITVGKTIDTLIATRCIVDQIPLLFSDRDFDPFVAHLGLVDALGTN